MWRYVRFKGRAVAASFLLGVIGFWAALHFVAGLATSNGEPVALAAAGVGAICFVLAGLGLLLAAILWLLADAAGRLVDAAEGYASDLGAAREHYTRLAEAYDLDAAEQTTQEDAT